MTLILLKNTPTPTLSFPEKKRVNLSFLGEEHILYKEQAITIGMESGAKWNRSGSTSASQLIIIRKQ